MVKPKPLAVLWMCKREEYLPEQRRLTILAGLFDESAPKTMAEWNDLCLAYSQDLSKNKVYHTAVDISPSWVKRQLQERRLLLNQDGIKSVLIDPLGHDLFEKRLMSCDVRK